MDLQSGFDELLSGLAQISSQSEESVAEDQITQLAVGEVRNCAVLFADIKGFTALSEKLRAEEVKLIIDHSFKIFTQEIKRYNGLVDKYIGDCIMAVFGSEVAGDNDSELAIRAGLSMLDRLEQINSLLKPKGIELGLRIGVNYGEVVYGSVGEGRDKDTTVMGDTVNTAQRMEANAPVNGLLITAGTKKYLGDIFIYEDRDPIYVKNKAEPVEVAVVRGINHCSVERWQRSAFAGRTKFVGRSEQIELLISLYEKCERGGEGNQLVLIEGVPGIGKSRLAYEFRQVLKERSRPGLRALKTGNPSYTTRPYYAITGLLRQYWEMDELEKADVTREKLTLGIEELARYSADQAACASTLPIIGNLLGLEYDDPRLKMDAASLETERKIAFKHLFSAIAEREKSLSACPLLIIVDDIQWADDASLSGLLTIASEVESSLPVFLLALSRNDTPVPEDWKEFAGFFSMELHPLSAADCAEIVSSMMPGINMPAR
ncbi:MAG: AAA family ATPase, partial [bacterium]